MEYQKLGEIVTIKYGKDHKGLSNGNIPVYGTGGLMRKVDKYLYDKPSVLIPRKGSLNNVMFVSEKFWTVDTMFWTIVNTKIINPKYLYYYLSRLNLNKLNVGSAVPSLTVKILNEIVIPVPKLTIQDNIVKKISVFDRKINLNNQINDNLDELKTAYFDKLFKQKMQSNLNGKLKNITQIKSGKRPERKSNTQSSFDKYPIVGASKVMGYTDKYLYNKTILTTGRVGTHGVVQRFREPVWVSDNSFVFETEHEDYLFEVLKHWVNYNAINRGSTQPLITQTDLKNINIYVPAKYEFNNFENVTNKLTNLQFNLIKQNQKLNEIKKSLLNSLFL